MNPFIHRLLLVTPTLLAGAAMQPLPVGATPPNILFIAIDDLRNELGCYGAPQVKSPNLDRLAAQGVRFDRAYCQVPVCGASRASLMTGILPTQTRFVGYNSWTEKDAPGVTTLPQAFREAGYTTLSNGKIFHHSSDTADRSWSEKPWNPGLGHDDSLDPTTRAKLSDRGRGRIYEGPDVPDNAYKDGMVAEKTIADLRRLKEANQPFFLACGFIRPHLPFYAPKKYWDLYQRDQIEIAANRQRPAGAPDALRGSGEYHSYWLGEFEDNTPEFHRMMRHGYYASVSYADKLVGDVLGELDRLGLADNTIVVVWGDHGWHLGEHNFWGKHNTLHNALRVPLIVRAPGKETGASSSGLVGSHDIFPTLCDLAGLPVPTSVQGRSFAALLDEPQHAFRDVVYSRFRQGDAVVTDRLIYTRYGDDGEMLYDLKKDPQENTNVAAAAEYRRALATMQELLRENMGLAGQAKIMAPATP